MMMGRVWSHIKCYWLLVAGVVGGCIYVLAYKMFAPDSKSKIAAKAKEKADALKKQRDQRIQSIKDETAAKLKEVNEASILKDEKDRLDRLSDLANRQRTP